jgi:cellulose biosynthesis protein BcsQ
MIVPVLTFFNNQGGVGKTTLVYNLAHMLADMGLRLVVLDLDSQANLTAAFLSEEHLEQLWEDAATANTIYRALRPLTEVGDLLSPVLTTIRAGLYLVPGDVALANFEDSLAEVWPNCLGDSNLHRPFRLQTAFWQIAQLAAAQVKANLIVVDVGPNLGAINRSALIGTDFVALPLGADLYSLQGLQNLGPKFRDWQTAWRKRRENWLNPSFALPAGEMRSLGYVVHLHNVRLSNPVKAYDRWLNRIPGVYHQSVLNSASVTCPPAQDSECLATLKHYRSLIPMAQEVRKPLFHLKPADGAIGSHSAAVRDAYRDFQQLAETILTRMKFQTLQRLTSTEARH